jgi:DNA/RNA-binding domain of Phe-tRNA-synthetase-like protein
VYFQHSTDIWSKYPELVAGIVAATGITGDRPTSARAAAFTATAEVRLAAGPAAEFPEIQAWRRVFGRMGLKPMQYRCASEALLRRFTKERSLPPIHPLVDLCNAISLAYAIPVAAIDVGKVSGDLEVRHAEGDETHETFSGAIEHPDRGEVSFIDTGGRAHAADGQTGRAVTRPSGTPRQRCSSSPRRCTRPMPAQRRTPSDPDPRIGIQHRVA